MKLNFQWETKTGQYQSGEYLYLNRLRVAEYSWNSTRSQGNKDDSITWAGSIPLPSLSDKAKHLYASSPEEIKSKVEQVVTSWFKEALVKSEGGS